MSLIIIYLSNGFAELFYALLLKHMLGLWVELLLASSTIDYFNSFFLNLSRDTPLIGVVGRGARDSAKVALGMIISLDYIFCWLSVLDCVCMACMNLVEDSSNRCFSYTPLMMLLLVNFFILNYLFLANISLSNCYFFGSKHVISAGLMLK